jgi:O-antigen ligase
MNDQLDNVMPTAQRGHAALFWIALVVVGVAFFCTEHNLLITRMDMYGTTQDELETNAAGGKLANQVGFSLIAALGGVLLLLPGGRRWRLGGVLPGLMLFLSAWCLASSLWSINAIQTAKRGIILLFCIAGALGIARQLTSRQVCLLCLAVAASYAAVGFGAEVALGTFKPLDGDYRFAGTLHPNGQGANCALLCLAAVCLLKGAQRGKGVLLILLACGLALMLLTRSRTACVALLASVLAVSIVNPSRRLVAGALAITWFTGAAALVALLCGIDLVKELPGIVLLGRAEHIGTLTGRTELWEELLDYAKEKPLLGYGYGSFWNYDHIDAISKTLFWDLSSAHSVYLEMVLGVGLIGVLALVLTAVTGLGRAVRQYWATRDGGDALVLALLAYGVVDGLSESDYILPSFMTFIAGCGVCRLAFFAREPEVGNQESGISSQESMVWNQGSRVRGEVALTTHS